MPTKYEIKVLAIRDRILDQVLATPPSSTPPTRTPIGHYGEAVSKTIALAILEVGSPLLFAKATQQEQQQQQQPDTKTLYEAALLSNAIVACVLECSRRAVASKQAIMDYRAVTSSTSVLSMLFDATLYLAFQSLLDASLPSTCIENAVEISTNMECIGIVSYLDSRLSCFKLHSVMQSSHYTILRTCITLLKRLSKSQDAVLCGDLLLLLAKFLPLTERSGVNLKGNFHTENTTPVEDVEGGAVDAEGGDVDAVFYKTFWGLQKWVSDPLAALSSPSQWEEISKGIGTVLDRFAQEKVTVTEQKEGEEDTFTSIKYLSSARLLPLQLRDATFRRYILIQALILLAWVEHPNLKDKKGTAEKGAKGGQLEALLALRGRVLSALEGTPVQGKEFTDAIRYVLEGESFWTAWKFAQCPPAPLQLSPASAPPHASSSPSGTPLPPTYASHDAYFGVEAGTPEMDELWNLTEDNDSGIDADDRGGFKTLRDFMQPVLDAMWERHEKRVKKGEGMEVNGDVDNDDVDVFSKDQFYSWKTLRLVGIVSLIAYGQAVRRGGDLEEAVRMLYPDEVPPLPVPLKPEGEGGQGEENAVKDESMDEMMEEEEGGDEKKEEGCDGAKGMEVEEKHEVEGVDAEMNGVGDNAEDDAQGVVETQKDA